MLPSSLRIIFDLFLNLRYDIQKSESYQFCFSFLFYFDSFSIFSQFKKLFPEPPVFSLIPDPFLFYYCGCLLPTQWILNSSIRRFY